MGLSLNDLDDVPTILLFITIFVPFSLVTVVSFCSSIFFSSDHGLCFLNNLSIHFFSSGVRIFSILLALEASL